MAQPYRRPTRPRFFRADLEGNRASLDQRKTGSSRDRAPPTRRRNVMGRETHQGRVQDQGSPVPIERQRRRVSDQGDRQGGSGAGGVQKGEAKSRDREADKNERREDDRKDR
jgi:hypothetical protein